MLTNAFSQLLFYKPRGKLTNYAISFVAISLAIAAELLLFGINITYVGVLFWLFLAVICSALVGGLYSGLISIVLSLVIVLLYTLLRAPLRSSGTREVQTLVFILASFIACYVINAVKSVYQITISILNSLQTFTIILNPKGQIVDINQTALQAFGLKRTSIVGRSLLSDLGLSYTNDTRHKIRTAIAEAREGASSRFDVKLSTAHAQTYSLDFSITPIYDRQGNVISLAVSANDITARVLTEKKVLKLNQTLEEKINELETLFKVLPVGIGISRGTENRSLTINPALAQMLNIPVTGSTSLMAATLERSPHFKFVKNGKHLRAKELPMQLAASKGIVTQELEAEIMRDDGVTLDILQYAMPIKDETHGWVGSIGAFVDITDFKVIEEKLRESQIQFKGLLNSNLIGVIVTRLDTDCTIMEANDAFCTMTGFTQADIKAGKVTWKNLTPPEFTALDEAAIKEMWQKGEAKPYEKEYLRRDGTRLPILVGAALVEPEDKVCVAFILDITARKKLEKRKDEFIGLASHELKTPLTSMKVFTQLLQRSLTTNKPQRNREYIDKMDRQIDRLTTLVEELLDVSKIEAGELPFVIEDFDLQSLVVETVKEIQAISEHHRLKITGQISGTVPGDAFRIKQVLVNVLTNAIKYSPQADQVLVELVDSKKQAVVKITDTGVGIPELDQKRVFEKFFRAGGKNKHSFPGLGLGLYLSKRIIERHGGTIELQSTEGHGSTVAFSLKKVNRLK